MTYNFIERENTIPKWFVKDDVTTQEPTKQCIRDIHQGLLDAGLVVVEDVNNLDIDNIPNIIFTQVNPGDVINYGSVKYTFADQINEQYPVVITLTYRCMQTGNTYDPRNVIFVFNIGLNITHNGNNTNQLTTCSTYGISNHGVATQGVVTIVNDNKLRIINSESGLFYITLFNNSKIAGKDNSSYIYNSSNTTFFGFALQRTNSSLQIHRFGCGFKYLTYQHTSKEQNGAIHTHKDNGALLTTDENLRIPLIDVASLRPLIQVNDGNTLNPLAFKTYTINTLNKSITENKDILVGYSSQIGNSGSKYEIELEPGVVGKYIAMSPNDNIWYSLNANQSLLFRYE